MKCELIRGLFAEENKSQEGSAQAEEMAENYESQNNDFVEMKSDHKSLKPSANISTEMQKRRTTEEHDNYSKDDVIQRENEVV